MGKKKVLIVDDEKSHRIMLRANLEDEGYEVFEAENGEVAVKMVSGRGFDCVLMDIRMPVKDGIDALKEIKKLDLSLPVIMMTAYGSVGTAVESMKGGAEDYLMKPVNIDEMNLKIKRVLEVSSLREENVIFKERLGERFDFSKMIGKSMAMQNLFETLQMVSPTDATVLILGESGVGKELVANAIHQNSSRKEGPFVKVNCAALPETLLESELFGHEKGAFTGAVARKEGRFSVAHNGTIFLDEIAELGKSTQAKILRVLQETEFEPLGSNTTLKVDVRIIAATNRELEKEMEEGNFREDLYYRLNVVPVTVPPLRERKEDISELSNHFLAAYRAKNRKEIKGFEALAMAVLVRHDWPGNVRELENVVERAVIMCKGEVIAVGDLPEKIQEGHHDAEAKFGINPGITLSDAEKQLIHETLKITGGNRTRAAEILGITRRTLQNKIKEYEIDI